MTKRSYNDLTRRLGAVSSYPDVRMETLGEFTTAGQKYPLYLMHLGKPGPGKLGVTISAGMHGDEPAGVEAALKFLEMHAENSPLLSRFDFIVFPCDNPSGCAPFL